MGLRELLFRSRWDWSNSMRHLFAKE